MGGSKEPRDKQGADPDAPSRGGLDKSQLDALRRKIAGRRDEPAAADAKAKPPASIVFGRDLPRTPPPPPAPALPAGPPVDLAEAVDGEEFEAPHGGRGFLVRKKVGEMGETWPLLCEEYRRVLGDPSAAPARRARELCERAPVGPEDVIFMDVETTGLSSSPVFLIGTMAWEQAEGLVVRQLFARNYAEERAIVSGFLELAAGKELLVSFNGKSFDVPYIRARAAACAVPFTMPIAHLDLLHECRRVWGDELPDCRLQTLETLVCGRRRYSDIPGHAIPDAYHHFVRTANAAQMVQVLQHNTLDLLTLADLITRWP